MRTVFWRIIVLTTTVLLLLTACDDPNDYHERDLSETGKEAFEDYIKNYATGIGDVFGMDTGEGLYYFVNWAPKGLDVRTDINGAWCILTTKPIWFDDTYALFFVVFRTKAREWEVVASRSDYQKAGCGY